MKFLIGLMLGALVTLFVATVFDVPTDSLVAKGKTFWNDFLVATGDALYEFPELPAVAANDTSAISTAAPAVDRGDSEADTDVHPKPTPLPAVTRDQPRDLGALLALMEHSAEARVEKGVGDAGETAGLARAEAKTKAKSETAAPNPRAGDDAGPDGVAGGAADSGDLPVQAVWVPFRSQRSAQGFASRLTGQLDHPFGVNREGPGRYQVIFSYANDVERRAMLDQVQTVTGEVAP